MDKFWMVLVDGKGPPRYKHPSYEEAVKEAGRLLHLPGNQGAKAFILKTIAWGYIEQVPITWNTWTA